MTKDTINIKQALEALKGGLENLKTNAELRNDVYDVGYIGAMIKQANETIAALPAEQQEEAQPTFPNECAATGLTCLYGPHGRNGERQCFYCGAAPSDAQPQEQPNEFKNFHRQLCERFGYRHDDKDWKRDQCSLIEHIAAQADPFVEGRSQAWKEICRLLNEISPGWQQLAPSGVEAAQKAIQQLSSKSEPAWQPIETAPKHKEVLCWREDQGVFIAQLTTPDGVMSDSELEECNFPDDFEEWFHFGWGWLEGELKPTRWMPKPGYPLTRCATSKEKNNDA